MARKSRRQQMKEEVTKEAEIDMTPMIDVVFLLIIFFLCIDFKILESKLPAYLPKDTGSRGGGTMEPQEKLRIRIVLDRRGEKTLRPAAKNAYYWPGHKVHFSVGATRADSLDDLKRELEELHRDPRWSVPDPKRPGRMKPMSVVIEPDAGTVYGDVAACVDAVKFVGFDDIHFGGGGGR
ncbi:MAG: biopolymer transporter ExbD [Planctomycetes bacterium]|nr:biopolymer transporter ExbD [Planctomycetota bacterium]